MMTDPSEAVRETSSREGAYAYRVGRLPMKEPFEDFSRRIAPPLRRRLVTHAEECGVKSNDVVISSLQLYLSRPRKTTPVARPTIVRKKGTKGGR